jgi:hypothetical protein
VCKKVLLKDIIKKKNDVNNHWLFY